MRLIKYIIVIALIVLTGCSLSGENENKPNTPTTSGKAYSPTPAHNSTNLPNAMVFSWKCDSYSSFDVYLSKTNPPKELYVQNITTPNVTVVGLDYETRYYWQVVTKLSNGTTQESDIWSFVTKYNDNTSGYMLVKHSLQTELPCFVKIMFQVLDLSGNGVDNLTTANFTLYENDMPISQSESSMIVRKKEENPYKLKTVLMLDNSQSLQNNLGELKAAALNLVSSKMPQQEFAIYKFSEKPVLIQDFTDDLGKLVSAINSIELGYPTTNLYGAVIEGASRWTDMFTANQIIQGAMIVFTDGKDTQGSSTLNQALAAIGGKRVYTVGLGTDIDPVVLQRIGSSGFYSSYNVSELTSKFLEIQLNLQKYANSFYTLEYMSPKRGNFVHTLRLVVNNNPYTGTNSYIFGTFNSNNFYSIFPGLYINPSAQYPSGVDTVEIIRNNSETVKAVTYLANNLPSYQWGISNTVDFEIAVDNGDTSLCTITAKGNVGTVAKMTVQDKANALVRHFYVKIR